ncbi:TIGR03915 family putative DNA repair protein [Clostridium swellfunianum]|uniref:TIGR03915 family putative DNA repair protein n=1 Tax=Clostridium swellfunianum TaxID=1367462 RepID=UPI00202F6E07|nr:TIGR03915 family putative DNA repair protein [Clostridium swellfunianum]MCM0649696.1 TIGR03915 family putative DNA repair protein [Clostridium swellfunianum]
MICYIFDGSFEGLLTSIYEAYYSKKKPEEIIPQWQFQATLLTEPIHIQTDIVKSKRVYEAIKTKISKDALKIIYHVYLSELEGCCTLIYNYIKLGFKLGSEIDLHLHRDCVLGMHNTEKKVTYECHRMLGFVRFKSIDNMFYSAIEPDHNILGLIASHFASRLPNENWIIHDLKRNLALFYNKKEWIVTELTKVKAEDFIVMEEPELYETLWKEFYQTIAIEDRKNPRLQKRMMPARYWKHLTELR